MWPPGPSGHPEASDSAPSSERVVKLKVRPVSPCFTLTAPWSNQTAGDPRIAVETLHRYEPRNHPWFRGGGHGLQFGPRTPLNPIGGCPSTSIRFSTCQGSSASNNACCCSPPGVAAASGRTGQRPAPGGARTQCLVDGANPFVAPEHIQSAMNYTEGWFMDTHEPLPAPSNRSPIETS